jgi:hypothetical protein
VSGRIAVHLDTGLGWTAPVFVAGCRDCGTELARSTSQAGPSGPHGGPAARPAAPGPPGGCPGPPARPPTSRWPGAGANSPAAAAGRLTATPPPAPNALEGGESPACPHSGLG